MHIRIDDLSDPRIEKLLREHMADMQTQSPPESIHALDLEKLKAPEVTFWTAWIDEDLAGCGAIRELDSHHGEIKSMRTSEEHRGRGIGSELLRVIMEHAQRKSYQRLSLETGTSDYFRPAQKLYQKFGFEYCGPFGDYIEDPYSTFMTLEL